MGSWSHQNTDQQTFRKTLSTVVLYNNHTYLPVVEWRFHSIKLPVLADDAWLNGG